MTSKDVLKLRRLIGHLRTAEKMSDELEMYLGNGGRVSALLSSMASELDLQLAKGERA